MKFKIRKKQFEITLLGIVIRLVFYSLIPIVFVILLNVMYFSLEWIGDWLYENQKGDEFFKFIDSLIYYKRK